MKSLLRLFLACVCPVILAGTLLGNMQSAIGVASEQPVVANCTNTHVVRRGETLSMLAQRYATTVRILRQINYIANPDLIRIGQVLCVSIQTAAPTLTPTTTVATTQLVLEATYAELTPTLPLDAQQRWGKRFIYPLASTDAFTSVASKRELIAVGTQIPAVWLVTCPPRSTITCTLVVVDDIAPLAALPISTTQTMTNSAALAVTEDCTGPVKRADTAGLGFTTTNLSIWLEDPGIDRQKLLDIANVGRVQSFNELRSKCIQNDEPTYLLLQAIGPATGGARTYRATIKEPPSPELPPGGAFKQWVCSRLRRAGYHGLRSKIGCL